MPKGVNRGVLALCSSQKKIFECYNASCAYHRRPSRAGLLAIDPSVQTDKNAVDTCWPDCGSQAILALKHSLTVAR
jgi:hypothetical protein